jgi:hypothetical protein
VGGDVEWHELTPIFPPGGRPRERVGGDDEWHNITHLFCRVDGFAFLPSHPPARRACATAVLRSADSMSWGMAPSWASKWRNGNAMG